jgi:hypothetical protein
MRSNSATRADILLLVISIVCSTATIYCANEDGQHGLCLVICLHDLADPAVVEGL